MWDKVRIHYWHIAKVSESLTTKEMKHRDRNAHGETRVYNFR